MWQTDYGMNLRLEGSRYFDELDALAQIRNRIHKGTVDLCHLYRHLHGNNNDDEANRGEEIMGLLDKAMSLIIEQDIQWDELTEERKKRKNQK